MAGPLVDAAEKPCERVVEDIDEVLGGVEDICIELLDIGLDELVCIVVLCGVLEELGEGDMAEDNGMVELDERVLDERVLDELMLCEVAAGEVATLGV